MSDVRVTGQPIAEPQEGLPPCFKGQAIFDGRYVQWVSQGVCGGHGNTVKEHCVNIGEIHSWGNDINHPEFRRPQVRWIDGCHVDTNDPDEAQAAFERGAEWVRTGEGP